MSRSILFLLWSDDFCSHASDSQLGLLLSQMKIGSEATREIVNLAKTSNYQLACQKHFDVTHPNFQALDLKMVSFLSID